MCDLLSRDCVCKDRQKKRISKFGATEDPIFRHTWLCFGRGVLVKCRQRFIFACDLFASLTSSKILSFGNVQINLTLHSLIRIFGCTGDAPARQNTNCVCFCSRLSVSLPEHESHDRHILRAGASAGGVRKDAGYGGGRSPCRSRKSVVSAAGDHPGREGYSLRDARTATARSVGGRISSGADAEAGIGGYGRQYSAGRFFRSVVRARERACVQGQTFE